MTPEEAIDFISNKIQIDVRFCSDDDINKTETALKLAISALEKQIPKKPIIKTHKYIGSDDDFVNKYHCPVCNSLMINEDTNGFYAGRIQKYCDDCGQALDWRETE